MDDWTRERFGPIPWRERYARTSPPPRPAARPVVATAVILARRSVLCGSYEKGER
jgi:hypothetical protein